MNSGDAHYNKKSSQSITQAPEDGSQKNSSHQPWHRPKLQEWSRPWITELATEATWNGNKVTVDKTGHS